MIPGSSLRAATLGGSNRSGTSTTAPPMRAVTIPSPSERSAAAPPALAPSGRGDEEQDHVEERVADEHAQERPTEPHREDPGHRAQVVARPGRPLEVLSTEESERADAQAVQEDADMQEEDGVRERGVREQPPARDGDRKAKHRDDERERDEHRLTGIARMDAEFLFQHEAKKPAHRHAPTSLRNADSRSASWARIWSTVPVAMIDPLRITATRWHSFEAMSRRWDAMNAVPPPAMYSVRNSLSFR